jgi:hypothetical protein
MASSTKEFSGSFRIYLAGLPPQISRSGTDFITTEPAAIILASPMVTPPSKIEPAPIKAFECIIIPPLGTTFA